MDSASVDKKMLRRKSTKELSGNLINQPQQKKKISNQNKLGQIAEGLADEERDFDEKDQKSSNSDSDNKNSDSESSESEGDSSIDMDGEDEDKLYAQLLA